MKNDKQIKKYIKQFENNHFHGNVLPEDIQKLIAFKLANDCDRIFKHIDVKLRDLGDTHPLISHDYLNDRGRSSIHTMANVQAMNEVAREMGVIAYGNSFPDGVIAYWPMDSENRTLFSLDTEGQYHLCLGKTLLETIYFEAIVNDFDKARTECEELFIELGIPYQSNISKEEIWKHVEVRKVALKLHPQRQRDLRYPLILAEPEKIVGYKPVSLDTEKAKPKSWRFWKQK